MKLGVLTNLFGNMPLSEALNIFKSLGIESLEIGCGGYPGNAHCDPRKLISDDAAREAWLSEIKDAGFDISALSVHGNPVHPDKKIAKKFHDDFVATVLFAEKIGIDTVVTFSGCPGGSKDDKTPNWVTCSWPEDYAKILDYQWNEVLIPYWKEAVSYANAHGVKKIALEMHPGFAVYNTTSLLRLREAVGETIGANFDPSHLIWQGMNPAEAVRTLGGSAIHHVHAKDTYLDQTNIKKAGVLSTGHYSDVLNRSWTFRTVGYGLSEQEWKNFVSMLRMVGYDGVLSIEHEDMFMSVEEGLEKAIDFLKNIMCFDAMGEMWWA